MGLAPGGLRRLRRPRRGLRGRLPRAGVPAGSLWSCSRLGCQSGRHPRLADPEVPRPCCEGGGSRVVCVLIWGVGWLPGPSVLASGVVAAVLKGADGAA